MQMEGGEYEEYPRVIYLNPTLPKPRVISVHKRRTTTDNADKEKMDSGSDDQQAAVSIIA